MTALVRVRGNLGQDFRLSPVNSPSREEPFMVLNFSIASPVFRRNAEGKREIVATEWFSCEYWKPDADHLHKILQKGMPALVEGEEYLETYTNRNGEEVQDRRIRVSDIFIVASERIEGISLRPKREQSNNVSDVPSDI